MVVVCKITWCYKDQLYTKNTGIQERWDFPGTQWLRFHASSTGGSGLIPGWGTKIPHVIWCSQKIKYRKDDDVDIGIEHGLREYTDSRDVV